MKTRRFSKTVQNNSTQKGFSLIEIMIAITIALVLMAGIMGIMSSSKRTYSIQQDLARLQENARFAMEFISTDLRMAGYFGCSGRVGLPIPWFNVCDGACNINAGGVVMSCTGANSSDCFRITYLDANAGAFAVEHLSGTTPILQTKGMGPFAPTTQGSISVGDTIIASDCGGAESRTVTAVSANGITINRALSRNYDNAGQSFGAEMRPLVANFYDIRAADWSDPPNGATNDPEDGFSLFRNGAEFIQGVEKMEIRYGVDTDGDGAPNQYLPASSASVAAGSTLSGNVVSARITLLMQTIEQRYDRDLDTKTYDLGESTAYDPTDDHRRRRIFSTVVKLRNQF
jgi:type IV pilus assembly protein PilW